MASSSLIMTVEVNGSTKRRRMLEVHPGGREREPAKPEVPREPLSDVLLQAPGDETDRVQEYHLSVYHCLSLMLEEAFFLRKTA